MLDSFKGTVKLTLREKLKRLERKLKHVANEPVNVLSLSFKNEELEKQFWLAEQTV